MFISSASMVTAQVHLCVSVVWTMKTARCAPRVVVAPFGASFGPALFWFVTAFIAATCGSRLLNGSRTLPSKASVASRVSIRNIELKSSTLTMGWTNTGRLLFLSRLLWIGGYSAGVSPFL